MVIAGVSVVIPTLNRPNSLKLCINSYLKLPGLAELIIINDGSTVDLDSVLYPYLNDPRIKYVRHTVRKGSAYSYTEGVSLSLSCVVLLTQDCTIASDETLLRILDYEQKMKSERIACISGRTFEVSNETFELLSNGGLRIEGNSFRPYVQDDVPPKMSWITGEVTGSFSAFSKSTAAKVLTGFFAVSKQVFLEMGGFDFRRYIGNHYREETDFHLRALQSGYTLKYDPRIVGFHCYQRTGGQRSNSNLLLYEYYVARNHALFLSRFYGVKIFFMFPVFIMSRGIFRFLNFRLNRFIPYKYFERYFVRAVTLGASAIRSQGGGVSLISKDKRATVR
jgi:GT2 family glycosyltransferase